MIPILHTTNVTKKTVLVRVDFNVPITSEKVTNSRKIVYSLPTINYLLKENCKIVLISHLGRPNGRKREEFSLKPIHKVLQNLLPNKNIIWVPETIGEKTRRLIAEGKQNDIFLLENLRFHKEEETNDRAFAHSLASYADIYVNDAFGVCHRKHASVHAITRFLPSVAGLLVEKEIKELNKALHPQRPSIWIIGGAKLDKLKFIEKILPKADYVLIGGALPFAFLRANGFSTGNSKIDVDSIEVAKQIMNSKAYTKIILPTDFIVAKKMGPNSTTRITSSNEIGSDEIGLDLGPETVKLFKSYLRKSHTVVWNGPLGYYEWHSFSYATKEIGRFIGNLTATSICGGGETEEALEKFHLIEKMTHVSTGGGASLAFLSEQELPALQALVEKK
jgi:3-phosphoglycerate kinase